MNETLLIGGFAILALIGLVACGIFAFNFGKLNTRLESLERAILKLEQRDEQVALSLESVSELKGELRVYKQLIDEGRELNNKQRQCIAKLLERSRIHGETIKSIVNALKENDIQININGGNNQNDFNT